MIEMGAVFPDPNEDLREALIAAFVQGVQWERYRSGDDDPVIETVHHRIAVMEAETVHHRIAVMEAQRRAAAGTLGQAGYRVEGE
jgi:hypothetical protein